MTQPNLTYQPKCYKDSNGNRIVIASGGTLLEEAGSLHLTTRDIGAVDAAATLATVVENVSNIKRSVITFAAQPIAMVDHTTAGAHGSKAIYDFPEGNIHILGAVTNLTTLAGAGGITDTAALIGSVGSVAVGIGDATLTSTEANIVPSTAGTLAAGAGVLKGNSTAAVTLDGTQTAAKAYLNLVAPDAGSTADDTITVSGTVTLTWVKLGDN